MDRNWSPSYAVRNWIVSANLSVTRAQPTPQTPPPPLSPPLLCSSMLAIIVLEFIKFLPSSHENWVWFCVISQEEVSKMMKTKINSLIILLGRNVQHDNLNAWMISTWIMFIPTPHTHPRVYKHQRPLPTPTPCLNWTWINRIPRGPSVS